MQANTGHSQNNQGGQQGNQSAKPSLSWSQPAMPQSSKAAVQPVITSAPTNRASAMVEKSYAGTYTAIFIAGIIIGVLAGWGIINSRGTSAVATTASSTALSENAAATTSSSASQTTSPTLGSSNIFTVSSPQTAGFAVAVSNLLVTQPTWVVIYEDHAGTPGNALGAELFLPQSQGTAQSGTVQLLRATLPGQTYLADEALDDGDKIFSLLNDKPVRDTQGNPLLVQFSTK